MRNKNTDYSASANMLFLNILSTIKGVENFQNQIIIILSTYSDVVGFIWIWGFECDNTRFFCVWTSVRALNAYCSVNTK